ncbi:SYP5 [Auxenochlorella protothecoides x Auxenochlorella symbiontica]|uniref:t-SNARE coiled-coil homology domain-containing protein n=1 Tax=Auxenochlorella protothecoides TaxID=3075 RepID=A0A1D2A4J8_AUXPR|nr:hypothetical protein APUTEX25_002734 [Auxenochlorella protothecoides]|eukprot:RMZ56645.1 hypothetical protein APUTEX25_002734 [Auxenochlorella protothecoides]
MSSDSWAEEYEQAKQAAGEVLNLIQERNLEHPDGGPGASRLTATARRKLGSLGTKLDALRSGIEAAPDLTENERNRRRDQVAALRNKREGMLTSLRRDGGHSAARAALLSSPAAPSGPAAPGRGRESEATAPLTSAGLLELQRDVMSQQDRELEQLERGVASTKHVALRINEEATLHNRLLEGLEEDVDVSRSRLAAAQRRLKGVMHRARSCKTQLVILLLLIVLVIVVVVGFKLVLSWF